MKGMLGCSKKEDWKRNKKKGGVKEWMNVW